MLSKEKITTLLKTTSNQIGCYLFKNRAQNVIYIGKAKNIKKRIAQHFHNKNRRAIMMLKEISNWETFLTNNEKEALILEHNLIKKHYPRYNILLSDDKVYPYIFISKKRVHPSYHLIYRKKKEPGTYYGPFPSYYDSREILQLLETLFPLWKCRQRGTKPCFYYHLQQCSGACFQEVPKTYYQKQLKKIQNFFQGKTKKIEKEYQKKIAQASSKMQFEQAKKWQNELKKIAYFIEKQNVEFSDYLDYDFINFVIKDEKILIVIFFYRQGKLQLKKENYFPLFNNSISETLENFLEEIYTYHPFPQKIVLPQGVDLPFLKARYNLEIIHPQRGKKAKILKLIALNAQNLAKHQAVEDSQKIREEVLTLLAKITQQSTIRTIEFLDLSYWDTKLIIAGFTHYLNGNIVFKKNKLYLLQTKKYDEKKLFEEAIIQHYTKCDLPDLIILDGNILQLQGAENGLQQLNQKGTMIALTKNKKHKTDYLLTSQKRKIKLVDYPHLLIFLEKIQTAGHLYVIKNLHRYSKIIKK